MRVALGVNDSFFIIHDDGDNSWSGIPTELRNKVIGRQKSLPPVSIVALGPEDYQYFVQFEDGQCQWNGASAKFDRLIQTHRSRVTYVSFGPNGAYFVKFADDHWEWCGIPQQLINRLNGRQPELPGIDKIAMDHEGGYWVRFKSGCSWWGGLNDNTDEWVRKYGPYDIVLGENGSYFMQTNTGPAWWVSNEFDKHVNAAEQDSDSEIDSDHGDYNDQRDSYIQDDTDSDNSYEEYESTDYSCDAWENVDDIQYSQTSISQKFRDGSTIHKLLWQLRNGMDVENVPTIRVVQFGNEMRCLDNRRLWAFKKAGLDRVPVKYVQSYPNFYQRMNNVGSGREVVVRQ
jgi:hypothetical protein